MKGKLGQLSYRRGEGGVVGRLDEQTQVLGSHVREAFLEFIKKQTAKHKKCCYVDMPIFRSAREAGQVI